MYRNGHLQVHLMHSNFYFPFVYYIQYDKSPPFKIKQFVLFKKGYNSQEPHSINLLNHYFKNMSISTDTCVNYKNVMKRNIILKKRVYSKVIYYQFQKHGRLPKKDAHKLLVISAFDKSFLLEIALKFGNVQSLFLLC